MTALTLNLGPTLELTDKQFSQICQANPDLRLERTANGELLALPPTGGEQVDVILNSFGETVLPGFILDLEEIWIN